MRRAARTDENQTAVVRTLRAMGVRVAITSGLGAGFPDALCRYAGRWLPIEIKDGRKCESKRRLTEHEAAWWASMGCAPVVVESEKDCEAVTRLMAGQKTETSAGSDRQEKA